MNKFIKSTKILFQANGLIEIIADPGTSLSTIPSTSAAHLTNMHEIIQYETPDRLRTPSIITNSSDNGEDPIYVNAKQYDRILIRRAARARLEAQGRLPKERRVCSFIKIK